MGSRPARQRARQARAGAGGRKRDGCAHYAAISGQAITRGYSGYWDWQSGVLRLLVMLIMGY